MNGIAYLEMIKTHLKTAYLLSDDRIETMIPIFLATLHTHMNRLAELAAQGETEQLAQASHAVKGALLNIGLLDLAETAAAIEKQCKNCTAPDNYRELINDLQYTVARFSADW